VARQPIVKPAMQAFVSKFKACTAEIAKPRKLKLTPPSSGKKATKKQGAHVNDVNPGTMKKRLSEFPHNHLTIFQGELFCRICKTTIGSAKCAVKSHCACKSHQQALKKAEANVADRGVTQKILADYEASIKEDNGVNVHGATLWRHAQQVAHRSIALTSCDPSWRGTQVGRCPVPTT